METKKDINRWWLNPGHRLLDSTECRSLRWHRVFELCLSKPVRSRRRFSSLDVRLHLPMCCVKHSRVFRNGKVSPALLEDSFRCLEDSGDRLSGQRPYKGIDRSRRKFLFDGCPDIVERICRIVFWEESLSVVRKLFARRTLADPFNESMKVLWPKSMGDFKSIPVICSHNLLCLFGLQHFSHKLMGQ